MPITAKLSRQFYEKLGDEVTNELVTWLNAVDESYRAEFRDLFGASVGQVRAEMAALRSELRAELAALDHSVEKRLATQKNELLFWMFLFWIGTVGALLLKTGL